MKKALNYTIIISCLMILVTLCGCSKYDWNTELKGETFVYSNGYTGKFKIYLSLYFAKNGEVTWQSDVAYDDHFESDHLRYTLKNQDLTIFHEDGTIFLKGTYYGDYIIIKDDKYEWKYEKK